MDLGGLGIPAAPVKLVDPIGAALGGYWGGFDVAQQQAVSQQNADTLREHAKNERNRSDMDTLKWLTSVAKDIGQPIGQQLISQRTADGYKTDENLVNFITSSKPEDQMAGLKS